MLQSRQWKTIALASAGFALCVGLGGALGWAHQRGGLGQWLGGVLSSPWKPKRPADADSAVLVLALQTVEERQAELESIAARTRNSVERSRARYLLATDAIAQLEGGQAVRQLENLEADYPLLGPYVHLKRARAYELTNRSDRTREELEAIVNEHPDSLLVAEALVKLSEFDRSYGDRAIAEYPTHPSTQMLLRERLETNPNQPQYLLLLAYHTPDAPGMSDVRDQLVEDYADQLNSDHWQAIADGYWEQWEYGKAASAYRKAPKTATNLYRIGRGLDLSDSPTEAQLAYENFVAAFPQAEEGGLALRHLARLEGGLAGLPFLERVIANFPDEAPTALLNKAQLQEKAGRHKAASQTRQDLLKQYADSDAAARYRWQQAKKYAEQQDYLRAWKWAQPIALKNPDGSLAPKASYWVGKWAAKLDRVEDARRAYRYVLRNHPESYYAWRSANQLGLDVGDFTTVQTRSPLINLPQQRPLPPAGSELFKELYQLGQDEDAATLWFAEQGGTTEPTVEEQFTTGLVQGIQGDYLESINSIWGLTQREDEGDRAAWQALRETPLYWHALFPFPFGPEIRAWSQERQVNPLLVVSLMRQESRFQTDIRSPVGALGLMQVMPATGEEVAQKAGIADYSLLDPDDNIAIGTWYLDFTHGEFSGNSMLAIASYNAGPGNVSQWITRFGLGDPDEFVEQIPFGETKGYVESVFGNYWNYLRLYSPEITPLLETELR